MYIPSTKAAINRKYMLESMGVSTGVRCGGGGGFDPADGV